jgi:hypothetical protein
LNTAHVFRTSSNSLFPFLPNDISHDLGRLCFNELRGKQEGGAGKPAPLLVSLRDVREKREFTAVDIVPTDSGAIPDDYRCLVLLPMRSM